jgi:hypothetical protein
MSQAWTIDERIDAKERTGQIEPPFTPDERALARAVAEAFYFFHCLTELPGRCPDGSNAACIMDMGISRVLLARKGGPEGVLWHDARPSKSGISACS